VPIENHASPVVTDDGELLGGVMVFRDVTAQRRARFAIERLNAELERRVVDRTAELEAAYRELEAFSDSVAQELRAPLRGIDGFSQALVEDHTEHLGPEGRAHLRRLRRATHRLVQLVDDLLRVAHIAKRDFNPRVVCVTRLARAVAADLQAANPERSVTFVIDDDITIDGDEGLLRLVLENLIGNAWKFTASTDQARIEVGRAATDRGMACFVRDNGVGFNMQYADKLFGVFQRLHPSSEFEGSGVGLAIVQRIIHRHGGRIWAESSVGRGTTLYFVV
jgi:light-regulated signal transduction histidine kinase (bacteriophytochrome)